ncbi:MAG: Crp/Fnr family transcriptional regulator [Leptolyngbya sp. SIO4C1]|nr:Crp/Fnr family transcriptional regulator [Leptolyngbya sp. SIO4C1]
MQPKLFSELFPLFKAASPSILEQLLSVSTRHTYPVGRTVLMEDSWGNAVYFIAAGWVKVRRQVGDSYTTLAVLGSGDFFGEMAILDESPRSTDVVALSSVELLSVPANAFVSALIRDTQLHHRMLQLMVQRLRQTNLRFQLRHQPPAVKLANALVALANAYGDTTVDSVHILNIAPEDLAAVADISKEEVVKIMEKLSERAWIRVDARTQTLGLPGLKQLEQLAQRL